MKNLNQNKNGFDLPDGFFEQQKNQLMQRITQGGFVQPVGFMELNKQQILHQTTKANHKPLRAYYVKLSITTAACFMLATLGYLFYEKHPSQDNNLSAQTIENYLIENDVDIEQVAELIAPVLQSTDETLLDNLNTNDILNEIEL